MNSIAVIALAGLVSYALRAGLILIADRWKPPDVIVRSTSLIAPAAFAAIAATTVKGKLSADLEASIPLMIGLVVAAAVVQRTGSANGALLAGLPTVWLLTAMT